MDTEKVHQIKGEQKGITRSEGKSRGAKGERGEHS